MATITYQYEVNDEIYAVNATDNCINKGIVYQVVVNIFQNSDGDIEEELKYLILLTATDTTDYFTEDKIFSSFSDASVELGTLVG